MPTCRNAGQFDSFVSNDPPSDGIWQSDLQLSTVRHLALTAVDVRLEKSAIRSLSTGVLNPVFKGLSMESSSYRRHARLARQSPETHSRLTLASPRTHNGRFPASIYGELGVVLFNSASRHRCSDGLDKRKYFTLMACALLQYEAHNDRLVNWNNVEAEEHAM